MTLRTVDLLDMCSLAGLDSRAAATVGVGVHVRCSCGQSACFCGASVMPPAESASLVSKPAWNWMSLR